MRRYPEQEKISGFVGMSRIERRSAMGRARAARLLQLQRSHNSRTYKEEKKNYRHTDEYIHLTHEERVALVREVADRIKRWGFARLFAECIDKVYFDPVRTGRTIEQQALEQIVSRFERYLQNTTGEAPQKIHGILIHDNNETVAKRHTALMKEFHRRGTLWTTVRHIVETPMFVNSSLTSMVQVADLCAYALRRYLEHKEADLFDRIFHRADRVASGQTVGVRHFTAPNCTCAICQSHV